MGKDGQKVWGSILSDLKSQVSSSTYKTWFSNSTVITYKKLGGRDLLIVGFKNNFLKEQVENRYLPIISNIKDKKGFNNLDVVFVVSHHETKNGSLSGPLFTGEPQNFSLKPLKNELLNPGYKFESFVVGQSNNIAYVAASQVSKNLGAVYNPLLIYGPTGVGKTHLLQAIGNGVLDSFVDCKVLYVTAEKFTNDYIESLRNRLMQSFRQKYRSADLLLVDDIQFLAGKESTQDEFFHCFNDLTIAGRQMVVACDRHPKELGKLKERLISRFLGGMVADINYPDFEMKTAILKEKCKEKNVTLSDEVTSYIAQESDGGARELEGVLTATLAQIKISGKQFSFDEVKSLLQRNKPKTQKLADPKILVEAVCNYFKVKQSDVCGKSRKSKLVKVRQVLMFLLRSELELSLESIGFYVGGRDHSTVIYGVEKAQQMLDGDLGLRDDISRVWQVLNKQV